MFGMPDWFLGSSYLWLFPVVIFLIWLIALVSAKFQSMVFFIKGEQYADPSIRRGSANAVRHQENRRVRLQAAMAEDIAIAREHRARAHAALERAERAAGKPAAISAAAAEARAAANAAANAARAASMTLRAITPKRRLERLMAKGEQPITEADDFAADADDAASDAEALAAGRA